MILCYTLYSTTLYHIICVSILSRWYTEGPNHHANATGAGPKRLPGLETVVCRACPSIEEHRAEGTTTTTTTTTLDTGCTATTTTNNDNYHNKIVANPFGYRVYSREASHCRDARGGHRVAGRGAEAPRAIIIILLLLLLLLLLLVVVLSLLLLLLLLLFILFVIIIITPSAAPRLRGRRRRRRQY